MSDILLQLPSELNTEGTCFSKCIQAVLKFYDTSFVERRLLGIENNLRTNYFGMSEDETYRGKIIGNGRLTTVEAVNKKLPVLLKYNNCDTFEKADEIIRNEILRKAPIIAAVNSYYINYMNDYLKIPGGYFKAYHMCVIVGYNEDEYIVADPWLDFKYVKIEKNKFYLAWTYSEGIKDFNPFSYYSIQVKDEFITCNLGKICLDSAIENLNYLIQFNTKEFKVVDDLKCIIDSSTISEEQWAFLGNLQEALFNTLSWSRRLFSEFILTEFLDKNEECIECSRKFMQFYDEWQLISKLILISLKSKNNSRLYSVLSKIENLIQLELSVSQSAIDKWRNCC